MVEALPGLVKIYGVFGECKIGSILDPGSTLTISVKADKGSERESAALYLMELFVSLLKNNGIKHTSLTRNTPTGDRIDGVQIYF